MIRGPVGRITQVRSVLPRRWVTIWAANWVGRGRGRKSTRPGANGVVELTPFEFLDRLAESPIYTAGTFDLVNGAGSVVFGGVLELAFTNGPYANGTDVLTIFAATGGFSGDFTSVVATGLGAGQSATFNAATGTISVVPEPSTCIMILAGVACGSFAVRRRRIAG